MSANAADIHEQLRVIDSQANDRSHEGPEWGDVYPWPTLDRAALYGLAGEIVNAIAPNTEADPVALLLTVLCAFGNAAGAASRALVDDDEHPPKLFVALVGTTASGGKGTSLAAVRPILRAADASWFESARVNGFASGEAIIARINGSLRRDQDEPIEKRAFVIETEFGRLLVVNGRDGSTASQIFRQAWDESRLHRISIQKEMLAEGAHLSLLAHVTPEELIAKLAPTDIAGGFANRVLFACVRRSRRIASPKPLDPALVGEFGRRLNETMRFAHHLRELQRSPEAEAVWEEFYNCEPDRDGAVGAITSRSAAQRLRLSVAYALLDCSEIVRAEHILAAEATWRYCAASAEHIFGTLRGDRVQDQLLSALRDAYPEALTGKQQHEIFGRNVPASRLDVARRALQRAGLIEIVPQETGGRDRMLAVAVPLRTYESIRTKQRGELSIRLNSYVRNRASKAD